MTVAEMWDRYKNEVLGTCDDPEFLYSQKLAYYAGVFGALTELLKYAGDDAGNIAMNLLDECVGFMATVKS